MSVSSVPQSPTFDLHPGSSSLQMDSRLHRLSLSPQQISQKSSVSSASASLLELTNKSPSMNRTTPHGQVPHLNLNLSKPQEIRYETLNHNVENSPQLLATSVNDGNNDISGLLVPSTSNISLLSLNQQLNHNNINNTTELNTTDVIYNPHDTSLRYANTIQRHRGPNNNNTFTIAHPHTQFTIGNSRKSSFNSPTLQGTQIFPRSINLRRSSSNAYQHPQQKQPIQIIQKHSSIDKSLADPDSPSLGPISLSESPSNFLLSHSSPPNSYKSSPLLSTTQRPIRPGSRNNLTTLNLNSGKFYINKNSLDQNQNPIQLPQFAVPISRSDSIPDSVGGRSPELAPVSTTLPPITPLVLSVSHNFLDESSSAVEDYEDNEMSLHSPSSINNSDNITDNFDSKHRNIDPSQVDDIFGESIDD